MVTAKMTMAETPEARKDDEEELRPACWKRRGAYYKGGVNWWFEV